MKTINVTFTDKEFKKLQKQKGSMQWHEFIILKGGLKNGNNKD